MKRKKNKPGKNTKFAIIFFVLVVGIVVFSLILKAAVLVSQSRFDNNHRFTINVSSSKDLEIISFSPGSHSVSILKPDENIKSPNIYRFLEIPIDAGIQADFINTNSSIPALFSKMMFNYKNIKSDITFIDIARLLLFTKTVSPDHIYIKHLSVLSDEPTRDKISSSLFSDDKISQENVGVEIVNAAGEYGLGNRLARLVTNMGGNVLLVSTAQNIEPKSVIFYSEKRTYTLEKLSNLLGFPTAQNTTKSIADITIRIGQDSKSSSRY